MKPRPPTLPLKRDTANLMDGRVLELGDEFTVKGTPQSDGRYSFRYGWGPDVTCFGPVGSKDASMRTFHPTHITTIHRTRKAHP